MKIDGEKLKTFAARPVRLAAATELRREGEVFFVGGELPIDDTLVTMFDSFCTESTDLFYLTFGKRETIHHGIELARQIRKNFNVRLMARFHYPVPQQVSEYAYAAGIDLLDVPQLAERATPEVHESLRAACASFPRWSVASTLFASGTPASIVQNIEALLKEGIVPLPFWASRPLAESEDILRHLLDGWKTYEVPVRQFMPLITLTAPLVPTERKGLVRGLIDRFHDRRRLAAADLRRHLRVTPATDSLDSAQL